MVRAVDHLVKQGRDDFRAVIVGDGPALASVRALATALGLDDAITFTGYLSGEDLLRTVSAFDIGVIPDPVNEYNDKISMNKVFEYGALGIPSVAYPLSETRRLLGSAGVLAGGSDPADLARACLAVMTDDDLRKHCAAAAANLAATAFSWEREAKKYVGAYERLAAPRHAERGEHARRSSGV
jgi:glycosyltransferase involved in cell wall biosynthesis